VEHFVRLILKTHLNYEVKRRGETREDLKLSTWASGYTGPLRPDSLKISTKQTFFFERRDANLPESPKSVTYFVRKKLANSF